MESRWTKTGVAIGAWGDASGVSAARRALDDTRVLCPSILALPDGHFRAFYMGHGSAAPAGTRGRIVSAWSDDGVLWSAEDGVRLDHHEGAETRVLSPCVVPRSGGGYRMYVERVGREGSSIGSAASDDGLVFRVEPGARIREPRAIVGSPRALVLPDGRLRLYFHAYPEPFEVGIERGNHVVSAISADGLRFEREPGVRIAQTLPAFEREAVYAAQPVVEGEMVRAYYSGWNGATRARGAILTAVSSDGGTTFEKETTPCIAPEPGLDAGFASEPCVFRDSSGRWRMLYEAADDRGQTRILGAKRSP
ncbi:MAG: hypothetical protein QM702_21300 [Rubrivivax sp.]